MQNSKTFQRLNKHQVMGKGFFLGFSKLTLSLVQLMLAEIPKRLRNCGRSGECTFKMSTAGTDGVQATLTITASKQRTADEKLSLFKGPFEPSRWLRPRGAETMWGALPGPPANNRVECTIASHK